MGRKGLHRSISAPHRPGGAGRELTAAAPHLPGAALLPQPKPRERGRTEPHQPDAGAAPPSPRRRTRRSTRPRRAPPPRADTRRLPLDITTPALGLSRTAAPPPTGTASEREKRGRT